MIETGPYLFALFFSPFTTCIVSLMIQYFVLAKKKGKTYILYWQSQWKVWFLYWAELIEIRLTSQNWLSGDIWTPISWYCKSNEYNDTLQSLDTVKTALEAALK